MQQTTSIPFYKNNNKEIIAKTYLDEMGKKLFKTEP